MINKRQWEKNSGYVHIKKTIEVFVCSTVVTARDMVFVHNVAGTYPEHGEILQCVTKEKYLVWRRKRAVLFCLARQAPCPALLLWSFLKNEAVEPQPRVKVPFLKLALTCEVEYA